MSNMISLILIGFTIFITGPIRNASIKSDINSLNLPSSGCTILIAGFIDAALYGTSLYLSIQTKIDPENVNEEKQFLQPISETLESILRTQTELHDLIKDINQNNTTNDEILRQNIENKLKTLEFIQNDGLIEITKNITKRLRKLKSNSFSNINLFDRVYYYIFTYSFLLYIHQFVLWILQYLSQSNPTKYLTCSFILSLIILCQSLGFIYFLQLTSTFHFLSSLCVYTCMFFIRSLINIHHYSFSI